MKLLQTANAIKDGHFLRGSARFVFYVLFFLLIPFTTRAIELAEISRLAKGGASQLALSLISEHQPLFTKDSAQWQRWERVRVRIMEEHEQWGALAEHLTTHPEGLPSDFADWASLRRAQAIINATRYSEARQLLRSLIWQTNEGGEGESKRLMQLRQLVMESYLEEGRIADAYAAMLRYQQDYAEQGTDVRLLRARVLLATDRAGDALALLQGVEDGSIVAPLRALASLRSGGDRVKILAAARTRIQDQKDLRARWLWLGVLAEAARAEEDDYHLIVALESMLPHAVMARSEERLFDVNADQLWDAYVRYADAIGNRERLLLGDDKAWSKIADKRVKGFSTPVRKRAIFALLALRSPQEQSRDAAHAKLITLLGDEGMSLLRQLYTHSKRFDINRNLPHVVAYMLVDDAIGRNQLELASRLLQRLPQPPEGTERFAWQMRRAKVYVLAGDYDEVDQLLSTLMPAVVRLSEAQRDQLLQVVFDLQAVSEHERALRLLQAMYEGVGGITLRRELLFWMADSHKAQKRHTEAARFYLQSATLGDNNSMDPWAQTARYQAARSLGEAGLSEDAAYIYRQLLAITESRERRSVLRHELQQLSLGKSDVVRP